MSSGSDASALIEYMRGSEEGRITDCTRGSDQACTVLDVPHGRRLVSLKPFLDEYLTAPERKRGTATLSTLDSFIAHANRFKNGASAVFADNTDRNAPRMISVIDYHEQGAGSAHFCEHRGEYAFPMADQWKQWMHANGRMLYQRDFAEFIEEHVLDLIEPGEAGDAIWKFAEQTQLQPATPAQVIELSRGLTVNVEAALADHQTLANGTGRIRFETKHKDAGGAELKIPGCFGIAIPVFRGVKEPRYRIAVRLRYRVEQGRVNWTMKLYKVDEVLDDAFEQSCEKVRKETTLPVFLGAPEVEPPADDEKD